LRGTAKFGIDRIHCRCRDLECHDFFAEHAV
jgi:hypothetical protein